MTSGLDAYLVHPPIRLSGGAPEGYDPDDEEEDWSCIDCGIPLEPGTPLICEECVEDGG